MTGTVIILTLRGKRMGQERQPTVTADDAAAVTRSYRWTLLLRRARRGDRAAFDTLLDEAEPGIRLYALQIVGDPTLAEDVVTETLEKVWLNLSGYNEELSNARTWIYLIAQRTALDHLDRRRRRRRVEASAFDALPPGPGEEAPGGLEPEDHTEAPPPEAADAPLRQALVEEALARLHPEDRAILELCHLEELSYEQIAERLGCTVTAVGPRLTRARARFRRLLDPDSHP
jgi:RNA polymerase sigma-70 factor (ECF subfamily)